jgi:hypothetical protein
LGYSRASKETRIGKGQYAAVKSIDATRNWFTVQLRAETCLKLGGAKCRPVVAELANNAALVGA